MEKKIKENINLIRSLRVLGLSVLDEFKLFSVDNFGLKEDEKEIYRINSKGRLETKMDDKKWEEISYIVLSDLLVGFYKVKKLPWVPKKGDNFYTFCLIQEGTVLSIIPDYWCDDRIEYLALLKAGWVYRTVESAQKGLMDASFELGIKCDLPIGVEALDTCSPLYKCRNCGCIFSKLDFIHSNGYCPKCDDYLGYLPGNKKELLNNE